MIKFLRDILSGDIFAKDWFRQQHKLILLICGLFFVYIYFGYQSERQQHQLNNLNKELQDAQFTQQTINAQVMTLTRQSSIARLLEEKGSNLKETHQSAIKID